MMRLSLLHVDTLHILQSCNPIQQKLAQKNIKPNFKSTVLAEIDPSSISAVISEVEYLDPVFCFAYFAGDEWKNPKCSF